MTPGETRADVSVVIPAFNSAATIEGLASSCRSLDEWTCEPL